MKIKILPDLIKDYTIDDIFNADETALFYKALPNKTNVYKIMKADDVKVAKERVWLLFIPRCFKSIKKADLPVYYRHNRKSWMDGSIFKEWLTKWNKQLKAENRNIILFLDNFSGHMTEGLFENIKIVFFPANCTSVLQPLDQGIIQPFKVKYRTDVAREKLHAIEYCSTIPTIDVLSVIYKIKRAWDNVSVDTIRRCFRKAGFNGDFLE